MQSVFQTKKKEPLMSVNPRMSVAPKQSTNSYSSTNPLISLNQSKNTQQSTFRSSAPKQSVFQPKSVTSAPQSKVILGSGMTTDYSSNPTNYKPSVPAPAPKPVAQPAAPSPHEAYLAATEKLAAQQKDFVTKQQAQREGSIKSKYQTLKEMISGQLPVAEGNLESFKKDSQADIDALRSAGERQKGQAEDYYGDAQRQAAKSFRETQGDNQRTFANLGTIDSRGEGSFQQATENTTSDFNRFTQQTLKAKADKFAEIDDTVSAAERQAMAAIRQEAGKLEDLKKQIQFALINNDQAMADELSGIAQESEQNIMAIQEAVTGLKYQADLEKYKVELETSEDLSTTFITTGVPQTAADYTWKLNNSKEYGEAFPDMAGQASSQKQSLLTVIDNLANGDVGAITGWTRTGWVPGSQGALTKNYYDQLKGMLSLENRNQLKGSGAISDFEAKTLERAASALNQNLSEDQFRQVLNDLRTSLGGGQTQSSGFGQNDPLGLGF